MLEVIGVPPSRSASILELFAANARASRMVRAERISRMDTLAEAAIDESPRRR